MFSGAKEIMDWLGTCAMIVAEEGHAMSWVTPLGLPVIQPYRKNAAQMVKTTMQTITLVIEDEALPVSGLKQQSAFPPNFVHSLDATHMLMTSLKMKNMGLVFAAVHDSYWTHACDVPFMSVALRECFVELYEQPVLDGLRDSLVRRYPEIKFPPVPKGGSLDLEKVKESIYFFH
jgi:DNA-directed RNA polymerase